ncbi:MAG TPA: hypothetical protein PK771_10365, partial [Spirochaetota bacterium]|nr:hypothetical protein [Spirochaetota bacterium]
MKNINFFIFYLLLFFMYGCSQGFFHQANKETFIIETLSDVVPSKYSGSYCPFYLQFDLTNDGVKIFYKIGSNETDIIEDIDIEYNKPIFIDSDCVISVVKKKENQISKVLKLNYVMFKNKLSTPIPNKISGAYNQFVLKFVDENDQSQIMYRISNESTNVYDLITTSYDKNELIIINDDCVVNAYKLKNNEISSVITMEYKVSGSIGNPSVSRISGDYFPFSLGFDNTDDSKIFYILSEVKKTDYKEINLAFTSNISIDKTAVVSYYKIRNDFISNIDFQNYKIISTTPDATQIDAPLGTEDILRWDELFYNKIKWSDTISSLDLKYHILFDFNKDGIFEYSIDNGNVAERSLTEIDIKNLEYNDCILNIRVDIKDNYGNLLKEGISKEFKYIHKRSFKKDFNIDLIDVEKNENNDLFIASSGKDLSDKINLDFMLLDFKNDVIFNKSKATLLNSDILGLSASYGNDKGAFVLNVDDNGTNKVFTIFDINKDIALGDIGSGFEGRTGFIKYYNGKFYLVYIDNTNKLLLKVYNPDGSLSSDKVLKDDFSYTDNVVSFELKGNYFIVSVEYLNLGITKVKSFIYNLDFSSYILYNCENSVSLNNPVSAINLNRAGIVWVENSKDYYYKLALVPEGTVGNKTFIDVGSGKKPDISENNNEFSFVYSKNYYGKEELYYGIIDQNGNVNVPKRVTSDAKTRNSLRIIGNDKRYI